MGGPEMASAGMECTFYMDEPRSWGSPMSSPGSGRSFGPIRRPETPHGGEGARPRHPRGPARFQHAACRSCKKPGRRVLYYIAPQAWAWRPSRARTLCRITDGLAVIFPFETGFFSAYGVNTRYVGHPFMENLQHKSEGCVAAEKDCHHARQQEPRDQPHAPRDDGGETHRRDRHQRSHLAPARCPRHRRRDHRHGVR